MDFVLGTQLLGGGMYALRALQCFWLLLKVLSVFVCVCVCFSNAILFGGVFCVN